MEREHRAPRAEPRTYEADCDDCSGPTEQDILGFRRAVRAINGKWKIPIICALVEGPVRFGALRRTLSGITQHMLARSSANSNPTASSSGALIPKCRHAWNMSSRRPA